MFTITVKIKFFSISGWKACDFCRAKGIPVVNVLRIINCGTGYVPAARSCIVEESFARLWFKPRQVSKQVEIDANMLTHGELAVTDEHPGFAGMADLSDERLKELFVAGLHAEN